jgi:hypothetical protein
MYRDTRERRWSSAIVADRQMPQLINQANDAADRRIAARISASLRPNSIATG